MQVTDKLRKVGVVKKRLRKLEKQREMHCQSSAESDLHKLTRAGGQLLKVTPDQSAPLIGY